MADLCQMHTANATVRRPPNRGIGGRWPPITPGTAPKGLLMVRQYGFQGTPAAQYRSQRFEPFGKPAPQGLRQLLASGGLAIKGSPPFDEGAVAVDLEAVDLEAVDLEALDLEALDPGSLGPGNLGPAARVRRRIRRSASDRHR